MAKDRIVKGSYIPRHDIALNWSKALNFVPDEAELIVYDADTGIFGTYAGTVTIDGIDYNYESSDKVRFKFGDGIRNINALPFATTADKQLAKFVEIEYGVTTFDQITSYVNAGYTPTFIKDSLRYIFSGKRGTGPVAYAFIATGWENLSTVMPGWWIKCDMLLNYVQGPGWGSSPIITYPDKLSIRTTAISGGQVNPSQPYSASVLLSKISQFNDLELIVPTESADLYCKLSAKVTETEGDTGYEFTNVSVKGTQVVVTSVTLTANGVSAPTEKIIG